MAIAEKYVNNSTAKNVNITQYRIHCILLCVADTSFSVLEYDFFLWTLFFRSVLYKGFDDVNHIVYCKKKIEIHVHIVYDRCEIYHWNQSDQMENYWSMIKSASHFWDALGCAKQRTNFYFDHYGNGLNVQLMIEPFFNKALDFQ